MQSLIRIFSILPRREYANCVVIFVSMLWGALMEAVGVGLIFPLISMIGNPDYLYRHPQLIEILLAFGVEGYKPIVISATAFLLVIYVLKNIYLAWSFRFQIQFSTKNQICFSKALMKAYLHKPYTFYINRNTSILTRNLTNGVQLVFNNMLIPAFQLMAEVFTAMAVWLTLAFVDLFTAVFVAIFLALIMLAILSFSRKKIVEQGAMVNKYSVQAIKWINQAFGAVKETKLMHKEDFFTARYDEAYQSVSKAQGDYDFINQLPRLTIEAIVVSGLLTLIIIKILFGYAMEVIVPLLSVLALAAFRLMPSANRIVGYANSIKLRMPLFNDLYLDFQDVRDMADVSKDFEKQSLQERIQRMFFCKKIEVRDLAFSYSDKENDVLRNVSFDIPKGAFVGIVGPSGAGKTTFVDVFLGLLSPTAGSVFVDGVDICTNIRGWQALVSYVPQDIYLIDSTIMENIALGSSAEEISEEKINRILQMVDLDEFVSKLPDRMRTNVGEKGIKLSGGQKQRIGLARALYQSPEILVLDEATSALDNETEKNIMDTIFKLRGQITIISVAHRLSTLEGCDFKVEFVNGEANVLCVP